MVPQKIFSPSLSTFIIRQIVPTFRENLASTVHCTKRGEEAQRVFLSSGKKSEKENDLTEERRKTKKRGKQNLPVMHWPKEEEKENPGDEEEDVDEKRRRGGTGK